MQNCVDLSNVNMNFRNWLTGEAMVWKHSGTSFASKRSLGVCTFPLWCCSRLEHRIVATVQRRRPAVRSHRLAAQLWACVPDRSCLFCNSFPLFFRYFFSFAAWNATDPGATSRNGSRTTWWHLALPLAATWRGRRYVPISVFKVRQKMYIFLQTIERLKNLKIIRVILLLLKKSQTLQSPHTKMSDHFGVLKSFFKTLYHFSEQSF